MKKKIAIGLTLLMAMCGIMFAQATNKPNIGRITCSKCGESYVRSERHTCPETTQQPAPRKRPVNTKR
ncbi:MAG: hypothetical protein HDR57_01365 [Treponema sp.]|nr:hypothetical protein [Treponema sp.]